MVVVLQRHSLVRGDDFPDPDLLLLGLLLFEDHVIIGGCLGQIIATFLVSVPFLKVLHGHLDVFGYLLEFFLLTLTHGSVK